VWGKLLGFLGLVLAIPLTSLIIAYYYRYVLHRPVHVEPEESPQDG
jgi:predicted PurR-regulated permease PerM